MGGKAALLVVIGLSTIMMMVGLNMNSVSTTAIDNSTGYYEQQTAKEIAKAGINLAASNLSRNSGWTPSSSYDYLGSGNLIIDIADSGDVKTVTSYGTYQGQTKIVEIKIQMASFSEYAYFSDEEGNIWWTESDSVWGPFHTNDTLQVKGYKDWSGQYGAYFNGPSTSYGGIMKYFTDAATDAPTIIGEHLPGTTIDIPTDGITNLASQASLTVNNSTLEIEFKGDSISYCKNENGNWNTVLASDYASNGIIYVKNADLKIKGEVKGRWTVGSNQNVYIEDDIVYSDVPDYTDKYDTSNDLLGIVSQNNVYVSDNVANQSDVNIHAAIYCQDGSFTAENYASRALSGSIHLVGGITQKSRGGVGTFYTSSGVCASGFEKKDYKYDSRLLRLVPPYFPSTNVFKILSWLE